MSQGDMLTWLVVGHFVVDFPLQGDFLAKAKNHKAPFPGVPWWLCLWAHTAICAGAVYLITGSQACAVAELFIHTLTDWSKNEGLLGGGERGFIVDQAIHVACKFAYAIWCFA